jgi:hypothetical protein
MATLPRYVIVNGDSSSVSMTRGVLRSSMDAGVAKQRPRYTRPIVTAQLSFLIHSSTNKALFDEWWDKDIAGGSAWFSMLDPISGTTRNVRIAGGDIEWACHASDLWQATVSLEWLN